MIPSESASETGPTFAFVDLAGFTALTEAHGDLEAADLVDRFAELTVAAIEGDGRMVKTIGDAVMLVFGEPAAAVAGLGRLFASVVAQVGFPILRAGIHQGPAVERAGDFIGAAVNLTARIAEQAHGGQTLGSEPIATAARAAGVDVVDLGSFELRNVGEPVELFDVRLGPSVGGGTIDPVCRMWVEREHAAGRLRYAADDYWFCSLACAEKFAARPAQYTDLRSKA